MVGIDLSQAGNDETSSINEQGKFYALTASVALEQTWREALQLAQTHYSRLPDVVVNCAGFVHMGAQPHEVHDQDFDRLWQVNVKPLYLTVKVVVQEWIGKGLRGHVINIGSIGSQRPRASTIWYTASKGAIDTV